MQFGVKIVVITSEKEVDSMEIVPKSLTLERVVYLSYLAGVHYNSIYLKGSSLSSCSLEHTLINLSSPFESYSLLLVVSGSETDAAPLELPGKSKNKNTNKSDMEPQGRNENDKNKEKMKKNKDRNQRKNK